MIDFLLIVMYLTIAVTAVLALWSVLRSIRMRDKSLSRQNNIPAGRIAWASAALLLICLLLTFALGSSETMLVNGVKFDGRFWLKAADMFINTSIILIVVAACGVAFGMSGIMRRKNLQKKV